MNPNGATGIRAELSIGARLPHLLWIGVGALAGGVLLLLLAGHLPRRSRPTSRRGVVMNEKRWGIGATLWLAGIGGRL